MHSEKNRRKENETSKPFSEGFAQGVIDLFNWVSVPGCGDRESYGRKRSSTCGEITRIVFINGRLVGEHRTIMPVAYNNIRSLIGGICNEIRDSNN